MESRPLGPDDQDQNTESTGAKKKRSSRLSNYLSILRGKEAPSIDSEETEAEHPRRVQRLFARLFPRIVERPTSVPTIETSKQHDFDPEAWFTWESSRPAVESTQLPEETADGHNEAEVTPAQASVSERSPVGSSVQAEASALAANQDDSELSRTTSAEADVPHEGPRQQTIELDHHQAAELGAESIPLRSERVDAPLTRADEQELVIERRGSNILPVALVAAEYLGRKKADKKLESRLDKKIKPVAEKQQRSEQLQNELDQIVAENKQQIEQLKRARNKLSPEQSSSKALERPETIVPATEAEARRGPEKSASGEKIKPAEAESVKPQNIAERVADAAEHDVPVERAFERSHEVKDETSAAPGAAASIGAVMAASATSTVAAVKQAQAARIEATDDLPFTVEAISADAYRYAIKMGFWSAICLMILGIIAYLMIRYI